MQAYKIAYVACVLIIDWGGMAVGLALGQELEAAIVISIVMTLLSCPLGFFASLLAFSLYYLGITTASEGLVIAIPIYAALGYLQWFRILPWAYRAKSQGK